MSCFYLQFFFFSYRHVLLINNVFLVSSYIIYQFFFLSPSSRIPSFSCSPYKIFILSSVTFSSYLLFTFSPFSSFILFYFYICLISYLSFYTCFYPHFSFSSIRHLPYPPNNSFFFFFFLLYHYIPFIFYSIYRQ